MRARITVEIENDTLVHDTRIVNEQSVSSRPNRDTRKYARYAARKRRICRHCLPAVTSCVRPHSWPSITNRARKGTLRAQPRTRAPAHSRTRALARTYAPLLERLADANNADNAEHGLLASGSPGPGAALVPLPYFDAIRRPTILAPVSQFFFLLQFTIRACAPTLPEMERTDDGGESRGGETRWRCLDESTGYGKSVLTNGSRLLPASHFSLPFHRWTEPGSHLALMQPSSG